MEIPLVRAEVLQNDLGFLRVLLGYDGWYEMMPSSRRWALTTRQCS
jgi:hypothetical protein